MTGGEGSASEAALSESQQALHAAIRRIEHLELALESNRRIGMAIGILMTRRLLTPEDAFHCLVQASQLGNVKLARIAEDVILTGDLQPVRLHSVPRGSRRRTMTSAASGGGETAGRRGHAASRDDV